MKRHRCIVVISVWSNAIHGNPMPPNVYPKEQCVLCTMICNAHDKGGNLVYEVEPYPFSKELVAVAEVIYKKPRKRKGERRIRAWVDVPRTLANFAKLTPE